MKKTDTALPPLTKKLVLLMAVASGITIANIYYIQPLLSDVAHYFHASESAAGGVATLTQIGFALGLLLILPLADVVEKRRLVMIMLVCAAVSLAALAAAPSLALAAAASFAVGFTSVVPQLLIPLGAQLAKPEERGDAIGSIMSGLLIGMLLSRVASGFIGEHFGWRVIYIAAALLMVLLLAVIRLELPKCPPVSDITYRRSLGSLIPLLREYGVLRRSAVIGAMIFCAFSAFWTALTFLLEGSPYHFGADVAGMFGLIGVVGASFSPLAGKLSDKKGPRFTVGLNLAVIIASYLCFCLWSRWLPGLIAGVVLLDLGVQCCNVSNQTRVHSLNEEARNRLTALYMVSFFLGGSLGSYLGSLGYEKLGWAGVCIAGLASQAIAAAVYLTEKKAPSQRRG